jgi:hypothetical protein
LKKADDNGGVKPVAAATVRQRTFGGEEEADAGTAARRAIALAFSAIVFCFACGKEEREEEREEREAKRERQKELRCERKCGRESERKKQEKGFRFLLCFAMFSSIIFFN